MAEEDKEAFLARWSRLKQEKPAPTDEPVAASPAAPPAPPLPPVDQLTPASDFTGFMNPQVEDTLRRMALKKLFSDPHFNIPDPFEAYSGDWTGGEAIPPAMLASLEQMKAILRTPESARKELEDQEKQDLAASEQPKTDEPGRQDA